MKAAEKKANPILEEINEYISPFNINYDDEETEHCVVMPLDDCYYKEEISCNELGRIAQHFIYMTMPDKHNLLQVDCENDGFYVYSKDIITLIDFITKFYNLYKNKDIFTKILENYYRITYNQGSKYLKTVEEMGGTIMINPK